MSDHSQLSSFCYNCGIRLAGSFCANCGQKAQELNPTFGHSLHDLTHELLHFDAVILSPRFMNSTRWLGHLMLLYSIVYVVLALRRAYNEKLWKAAVKMLVVGIAYACALAGAITGAALVVGN
jgi:hypothetical protein